MREHSKIPGPKTKPALLNRPLTKAILSLSFALLAVIGRDAALKGGPNAESLLEQAGASEPAPVSPAPATRQQSELPLQGEPESDPAAAQSSPPRSFHRKTASSEETESVPPQESFPQPESPIAVAMPAYDPSSHAEPETQFGEAAPSLAFDPALLPSLSNLHPQETYLAPPASGATPSLESPALQTSSPDPGSQPIGHADTVWRLLTQLAVHDTNAATLLIDRARQDKIPKHAWPGIAVTLLSESPQDGLLVPITASALSNGSEEELNRRLDLLEALLAITPDPVARQVLRSAAAWFLEQLSQ